MDIKSNITIKSMITRYVYSFLISVLIFYQFNPLYIVYAIVSTLIWVTLIINYKIEKNRQLYIYIVLFNCGNLTALIVAKYFVHNTLHMDYMNIVLLGINCFLVLLVIIKCIFPRKGDMILPDYEIFPKRKYDLSRIESYINNFDIIGVNGIWGSGKTFVINELKKYINIQDNYIFIEIDLLSCNLDEIQVILLSEMEKVLKSQRIIAHHSYKLKRILGDKSILRNIKQIIIEDDVSYLEAIEGFKKEINFLDKSLIIVYEDIDRISDTDVIKKIFSISEKLSSQKIKILYQYDENNLKQLGFDKSYLEKYIPYVVNLTDIDFFEVLEYLFQEKWMEGIPLTIDEFKYLKLPIYGNHEINKILNARNEYNLHISGVGIRKVKHFLYELTAALKENEQFCIDECKKTVITFYFIKHFYEQIYEQLNLELGLLDTLKFKYNNNFYTILEIINLHKLYQSGNNKGFSAEDIKNILAVKKNYEAYAVICLFEYNLDIYEMKNKRDEFVEAPTNQLTNANANEKKDRLIWNMLCGGKSEYTDIEVTTTKLISDVLDKPKEKWHEALSKFNKDLFYGEFDKKDNRTIFRIGIPQFISLFQSFHVVNPAPDNWIKLIELYFNEFKEENITIEIIEIFNYCNLNERKLYIEILKRFNNLNIIGNMNNQKCYYNFIKNYLRALSSLTYIDTNDLWMLEVEEDSILNKEIAVNVFDEMRRKMLQLKEEIPVVCVQEEITIIIEFIEKNNCLINSPKALIKRESSVHTEMRSIWPHQEEVDRIKSLNLSREDLIIEIGERYKEGKLGAAEIKSLLEKI